MMRLAAEKLIFRAQVEPKRKDIKHMGDRSPKSNQKKSGQKQSKNNAVAAKKKAAVASKQTVVKK